MTKPGAILRTMAVQAMKGEETRFDEMYDAAGGTRAHYEALAHWLAELPSERLLEKRREADLLFHRVGITFAVYGDEDGTERLIPFDTIPRIIARSEWQLLEQGLWQRVLALSTTARKSCARA